MWAWQTLLRPTIEVSSQKKHAKLLIALLFVFNFLSNEKFSFLGYRTVTYIFGFLWPSSCPFDFLSCFRVLQRVPLPSRCWDRKPHVPFPSIHPNSNLYRHKHPNFSLFHPTLFYSLGWWGAYGYPWVSCPSLTRECSIVASNRTGSPGYQSIPLLLTIPLPQVNWTSVLLANKTYLECQLR